MSNATETYERVLSGFVNLLGRLRGIDDYSDVPRRIMLNTIARERAQERTRQEYAAIGMIPPSDLALGITARRVMADVDAERRHDLPVDQPEREAE